METTTIEEKTFQKFHEIQKYMETYSDPTKFKQNEKHVVHFGIKDFDQMMRNIDVEAVERSDFTDEFYQDPLLSAAGLWFSKRTWKDGRFEYKMKRVQKIDGQYLYVVIEEWKSELKALNLTMNELKVETTFDVNRLLLFCSKEKDCRLFADFCKFKDHQLWYVVLSAQINAGQHLMGSMLDKFQDVLVQPVRSKIMEYKKFCGQLPGAVGTEWFTYREENPIYCLKRQPKRIDVENWLKNMKLTKNFCAQDLDVTKDPYEKTLQELVTELDSLEKAQALYYALHRWKIQENLPVLYGEAKKMAYCNPDFKDPAFKQWLSNQLAIEGFVDKLGHEDVKNILAIAPFIGIGNEVLKAIRKKNQEAQMQRNAYLGAQCLTLTKNLQNAQKIMQ